MKKLLSSGQAGSHDEIRLACCYLKSEGLSFRELQTYYGLHHQVLSQICKEGHVVNKGREKYQWAMITALCRHRFKLDPQSQAYAQCTAVLIEVCNLCTGLPHNASVWDMVENKWKALK